MTGFQTLREGRIQIKVDAEDRRLLDELVLQGRQKRRHRRPPVSIADVLIPWIEAWCRRRGRFTGVGIAGEALRVDCRAVRFPHHRVCQRFASRLEARGEKNASAVLRAIIQEHIEPIRTQLKAAAREREADERRREVVKRKTAKQQQYRTRFEQDAVADAIELFLSEIGKHYRGRAVERLDRDAAALAKLGLRVADHFVAVTTAITGHNPPAARQRQHEFADQFVRILGFALARPIAEGLLTRRCDRCSALIVLS